MHPIAPSLPASEPSPGLVHGPGSPLEDVLRACRRIAASDATVLVTGETGTGKEVIARFVHEHSPRAGKALVPVNCGAIPEALLESELFGYVRGAFTGATAARRGRVALAEGGTLFLDEIGELPLSLQVKLLRVIQERRYEPVGSAESIPANFRLIAATNRDLAAEVEAGRFRRDLYFRLMVVPLELPPLRARPGDIVALFRHFWQKRGETRPLAPEALARLEAYPWPGNVRELENLAERLSVCTEGAVIRVEDLPVPFRATEALPLSAAAVLLPRPLAAPIPAANADLPREPVDVAPTAPADAALPPSAGPLPAVAGTALAIPASPVAPAAPTAPAPLAAVAPAGAAPAEPVPAVVERLLPIDLPALLRRLEDEYIDRALERSGGNKKAAAESLGLQRTTLVEKLRRRQRETHAS
jgi:sigma-54 specific flagellar transcriptional regulator A